MRSAVNLTDASGTRQWTYNYEPYGPSRTETQDSGSAPTNSLKFMGEQLDATGLYHLRARQYDFMIGRFVSADLMPQLGHEAAASTYSYVVNRPTVFVDPLGLRWCWKACPAVDATNEHVVQPTVNFARDYYPRSAREAFPIYTIVETGLATAVVAGGTVVTATVVCPAVTATGGPVGAVARGQLVVTGAILTVARAAATVKEVQHYAHERRGHLEYEPAHYSRMRGSM